MVDQILRLQEPAESVIFSKSREHRVSLWGGRDGHKGDSLTNQRLGGSRR